MDGWLTAMDVYVIEDYNESSFAAIIPQKLKQKLVEFLKFFQGWGEFESVRSTHIDMYVGMTYAIFQYIQI